MENVKELTAFPQEGKLRVCSKARSRIGCLSFPSLILTLHLYLPLFLWFLGCCDDESCKSKTKPVGRLPAGQPPQPPAHTQSIGPLPYTHPGSACCSAEPKNLWSLPLGAGNHVKDQTPACSQPQPSLPPCSLARAWWALHGFFPGCVGST